MPRRTVADEPLLVSFGAQVRALRRARGFSLDQLARRGGLFKGSLSAIENGLCNPTLKTLGKVAQALGVGLGELVGLPVAEPGPAEVEKEEASVARAL